MQLRELSASTQEGYLNAVYGTKVLPIMENPSSGNACNRKESKFGAIIVDSVPLAGIVYLCEKETFRDAEEQWLSSARGMDDDVRSAFVSVLPRPITCSPGYFMNYPGYRA